MSGLVTISVVGAKPRDHAAPVRVGHGDLDAEANGDDAQQRDDESLDPAEPEILQVEDQEDVERRDERRRFRAECRREG